jgi:hypothetical protein
LARLTVPPAFRPGLVGIASLTDESYDSLISSLRSVEPAGDPAKLASKLVPDIPGISEQGITEILEAILSLYVARSSHEVDVQQFVEDVVQAMETQSKAIPPSTIGLLKPRLTALLGITALGTTAKAFRIQREHQKVLVSARIFSDIRPVFSEDGENPLAGLVFHQLKLSYLEGSERRDFFLALDDEDISSLQKLLTRAETKSKALSALIEKADLVALR